MGSLRRRRQQQAGRTVSYKLVWMLRRIGMDARVHNIAQYTICSLQLARLAAHQ